MYICMCARWKVAIKMQQRGQRRPTSMAALFEIRKNTKQQQKCARTYPQMVENKKTLKILK